MKDSPAFCFFVESRQEWSDRGFRSRRHFLDSGVLTEAVCQRLALAGDAVALASQVDEDGMTDLVQRITGHGVSVDLWLNVPTSQDYWLWRGNIDDTARLVDAALEWILRRGLRIRRLGLDLETPLALAQALFQRRPRPLVRELLRARRAASTETALVTLVERVNTICPVDFYLLPVLSRSAWLRRNLGLHHVPAQLVDTGTGNRAIPMLYSSALPPLLRRQIGRLHVPGQGLAIGVLSQDGVSPGVDLTGNRRQAARLLDDRGLLRDLRQVAALRAAGVGLDEVHVFALNGAEVLDRVSRSWSATTPELFEGASRPRVSPVREAPQHRTLQQAPAHSRKEG